MSASSDQDTSESAGSPRSYFDLDSPYSSPSQTVPNLANGFNGLIVNKGLKDAPHLKIIIQPQEYFRFRYKSEMSGTHGCLQGRSTNKKAKTHPTVELVNYRGRARIKYSLVQSNCPDEHPHQLAEDDQGGIFSREVPEKGLHTIGFGGIGIIYRAQKEIPQFLLKKNAHKLDPRLSEREKKAYSENLAKNIDLNKVRLKFSAYDVVTGLEICPPVFSEPIRNEKSAKTNNLKICRMSKCHGKATGGEDVYIFVEKVSKKNIRIRFFELNEDGEECWTADGIFLQTDVHHQYAIVFRTPQYRNTDITSQVKVRVELVRPSDGERSKSREFTYHRDPTNINNKKRKQNSYSSWDSNESLKSANDIPITVSMNPIKPVDNLEEIKCEFMNHIPQLPSLKKNEVNLKDAVFNNVTANITYDVAQVSPLLSSTAVVSDHVPFQLQSSDYERLLQDTHMPSEEKQRFYNEVLPIFTDDFLMSENESFGVVSPDSGYTETTVKTEYEATDSTSTYTPCYTAEAGAEVKQLVNDLCEIVRNKKGHKKEDARAKLDRLFELRLSNGDTFLHMTLHTNQTSMAYIIKIIRSLKMTHLLNFVNEKWQTVLHVAVLLDLKDSVPLLVSHGCDPNKKDTDGNTALHYAVMYSQGCLSPLLNALRKVTFDVNATNNEIQTPLHLAAITQRATSAATVRCLVGHGALAALRDHDGRTALHLAAYDGYLEVLAALCETISERDIDLTDPRGNTALQIVCGRMTKNTVAMAKLLLDRGANPLKQEGKTDSAIRLCDDKPELKALVKSYVVSEDDIKSEVEDFESADEGDNQVEKEPGMAKLSLYLDELAKYLDETKSWRDLVRRLGHNFQVSVFEETRDPARTLLTSISDMDQNMTSKHLSYILEDMHHKKAADIIRKYIN